MCRNFPCACVCTIGARDVIAIPLWGEWHLSFLFRGLFWLHGHPFLLLMLPLDHVLRGDAGKGLPLTRFRVRRQVSLAWKSDDGGSVADIPQGLCLQDVRCRVIFVSNVLVQMFFHLVYVSSVCVHSFYYSLFLLLLSPISLFLCVFTQVVFLGACWLARGTHKFG